MQMRKHRKGRALIAAAIYAITLVAGWCMTGCQQNTSGESLLNTQKGEQAAMQRDTTPIASSDELLQTIVADSMVMLKNDNNCLPLAKDTKINLFGYNATDRGFLLTGGGSGSTRADASKNISLLAAFQNAGVEVNMELYNAYYGWDTLDLDNNNMETAPQCILTNPGKDFYTDERMQQAKTFSDTAIVVLSRWGREGGSVNDNGKTIIEIPTVQVKSGLPTDKRRTYLQISTEEELMLEKVTENFDKVIVLLNTCNTMELGFLDDPGIDAALFIGVTGQSGAAAIPRVLYGDVCPSGRTADVYPYNHRADPTWANARPNYSDGNNKFVSYPESLYYGYRWYETAFADGIKLLANGYELDFSSEEGYRKIVQYPFGYGLSYTEFTWELAEAPAQGTVIEDKSAEGGSQYTVKVKVTNVGAVAGKDVVQLYVTPPYTPGGVEKAAVSLVDFAKTDTLQPGESQVLSLSFTDYDLASYDCYDANGNGFAGYELEKGDYALKLMRNSHELAQVVAVDGKDSAVITLRVEQDIRIVKDYATGATVENLFTGENSYGSPVDGGLQHMSRKDFAGTFTAKTVAGKKIRQNANTYTGEKKTIAYGQDNGLYLVTHADGSKATLAELQGSSDTELFWNKDLVLALYDYDNEELWDKILSQLSKEETVELIKIGGFVVAATESIGMPIAKESDGPSGVNRATADIKTAWCSESLSGCSWNEELLYTMGRALGTEAKNADIQGLYAPGVNLHRSPYTSRNFEYYSEDPILSGKLAAQVIRGAKNEGLTCYLKHFAVSEGGKNPTQVNTWLTEQALREIYLKAFEIAVKDGKTNAVMSAFNNIGDVYCGHNQALLQDILREEWGFRGVVITDWWRGYMTIEACVIAGNDKMLRKTDVDEKINLSDDSGDVANAARDAVKNILYSVVDSCVTGGMYELPVGDKEVTEAVDEAGAPD